jgi:hypothetical protein
VERDAESGAVVGVSGRLCPHFGREGRHGTPTAADGSGKPRSNDTIKHSHPSGGRTGSSSISNWLTMLCGLEVPEPDWGRDRVVFRLGFRVPYVNAMEAHVDIGCAVLYFWVNENILSNVIGGMIYDPMEYDVKVENALTAFKRADGGPHSECSVERKVTIKNVVAFRLVVEYVGAGLSFRQA